MRRTGAAVLLGGLLVVLAAQPADARVARIVVEQTAPYAGGKSFGEAGPFERLDGTVYLEVDPDDPLNAVIVNLDRVPRNARGLVEFSAPFFIIKPVDLARGNGKLLYGVNNRGNAIELGFQTFPPLPAGADPESGDGLFFRLGYSFVDAGWAGDVLTTATRLGANLPVAVQADGSPIVSRIRIEYPSDPTREPPGRGSAAYTLPLKGNDRFLSYETADTDTAHSTLTVRDAIDGKRRPIPPDRWAFGQCPAGEASLSPSTVDICLFDGFQPDKVYELIYPARNPWVMGLGYAVTRDVASFLRYETTRERRIRWRAARMPSASAAPTGSASRPPGCTCATTCTSASTRTSRTAACSMRCASTSRARTGCSRTWSSRTPTPTPGRTGRPTSPRTRTRP